MANNIYAVSFKVDTQNTTVDPYVIQLTPNKGETLTIPADVPSGSYTITWSMVGDHPLDTLNGTLVALDSKGNQASARVIKDAIQKGTNQNGRDLVPFVIPELPIPYEEIA